jgi:hypothetical protein
MSTNRSPVAMTSRPHHALGHHVELALTRFSDDGSSVGKRLAGASQVDIRAGFRGTERVVPPAGEDHAYDRDLWERHVQVYVSPTGRSVRVFVDGQEIPAGG